MASSDNSKPMWRDFLADKTVSDLMASSFELIQVNTTTTIPDALQVLSDAGIQSMPVYDEEKKEYAGLVDILDMVATVVALSDAKEFVDILSKHKATWYQFLNTEHEVFSKGTVGGMINVSQRNPWCATWEEYPLISLMDMFGKDSNLHRVPVVDSDGKVKGLITQSAVLKWLAENLESFHLDSTNQPLSSWHKPKDLVCVDSEESVLDAFRLILEHKVSGVAVKRQDGTLFGAISASDLKGAKGAEIFLQLYNSVRNFLLARHPDSTKPISITSSATMHEIVNLLQKHHIHRLFVVDEKNVPYSVITLADVISVIQSQKK